ncbi:MAG TPA: hypothetical protein VHA75_15190, partial [Rugosimonospora sp.]|nr:hypothetical protein [Rugosimonospora sp.]
TCGSTFDTVLSVHSACPGTTANQLACNDDNNGTGGNGACGGGLSSGLNLAVTAGTQYSIRVGSYNNNAGGGFILNIIPIAPANDACAGSILITPGTYTGTTGFAGTDGAAACGFSLSAPDVWYTITPPTSGLARLDTCTSTYDTVLSVHTGCPGNLDNQLGCDDDDYWNYGPCPGTLQSTVNVPVSAGGTYYVRVAGYNGHNGAYTLHYNLTPIGNDTCDAATPITFGTYSYNNTGATTDGPTEANCSFCCGDLQINQDVWYSIVAPCARPITIDTFGSSYDTKLGVYAFCPTANDQAVACNDDYPNANNRSQVTFTPTAGTRYMIRVGSYSTAAGAGVLHVRACLPDFNCDGAVTVQDIFDFLSAWFAGC